MAIRLRPIGQGQYVALCAARSMPGPEDLYLDDALHHALSDKFREDFDSEGFYVCGRSSNPHRERHESQNPNRAWWDCMYGDRPGDPDTCRDLAAQTVSGPYRTPGSPETLQAVATELDAVVYAAQSSKQAPIWSDLAAIMSRAAADIRRLLSRGV